MAKFCANISFMFIEKPFLDRYNLAKSVGFKAVESGFPYGIQKEHVVDAKNAAGVDQILVNVYTGDVSKGQLGFAAIPGKEKEFRDSLVMTLDYAKALGVKKIHIMAGKVEEQITVKHDSTYVDNLKYAAEMLEKENILGLIEPINVYSVPHYYMNNYEKAVSVIKQVDSPKLKLMLDIFHLQLIKGNIINTMKELKDIIGHVQIAQVPYRNEPNTYGELNYEYVLKELKNVAAYDDWIGLEYKPALITTEGLKWIEEFGYNL
nr:unnamed protein product [Callosobruchus analis]CAI5863731.1 unnamed protein product [Callosobruchus analis]